MAKSPERHLSEVLERIKQIQEISQPQGVYIGELNGHVTNLISRLDGVVAYPLCQAGSSSKQTVSDTTLHIDYLVLFESTTTSVQNMSIRLRELLKRHCEHVVLKGVIVQANYKGCTFDYIPAKKVDSCMMELFDSTTRRPVKTNLDVQTMTIRQSAVTDDIILIKRWRDVCIEKKLIPVFPSLYVGLVVMNAITADDHSDLFSNFTRALQFIYNELPRRDFFDPGNPINKVSDLLSAEQKQAIADQALIDLNRSVSQVIF